MDQEMDQDGFEAELDQQLEHAFAETFAMAEQSEEASWHHFTSQTLPDKQAWIGFRVSMTCADLRLRQATRWTHWATYLAAGQPRSQIAHVAAAAAAAALTSG